VSGALQRSVLPGEGWVYLRVYRRYVTDDELLALLAPALSALQSAGSADGWFFVPYTDLDPELRVRVRSRADADVLHTVRAALRSHLESGAVWRLELGTYEREVDRYGGPAGMPLCEELFLTDSAAVVDMLQDLATESDDAARLCSAALGVIALVRDFGFDAERTLALWRALAGRYRAENRIERAALAPTARVLGPRLRAVLEPDAGEPAIKPGWVASVERALNTRSHASASTIAALRALAAAGGLTVSLDELLESLVHMHCVRLLRGDVRKQECVLYDLLERRASSSAARARVSPTRS
jgi:thiopeptide-type bacteriocin biosynthesis protein